MNYINHKGELPPRDTINEADNDTLATLLTAARAHRRRHLDDIYDRVKGPVSLLLKERGVDYPVGVDPSAPPSIAAREFIATQYPQAKNLKGLRYCTLGKDERLEIIGYSAASFGIIFCGELVGMQDNNQPDFTPGDWIELLRAHAKAAATDRDAREAAQRRGELIAEAEKLTGAASHMALQALWDLTERVLPDPPAPAPAPEPESEPEAESIEETPKARPYRWPIQVYRELLTRLAEVDFDRALVLATEANEACLLDLALGLIDAGQTSPLAVRYIAKMAYHWSETPRLNALDAISEWVDSDDVALIDGLLVAMQEMAVAAAKDDE